MMKIMRLNLVGQLTMKSFNSGSTPDALANNKNMKLVENSNLPNIQTSQGLYAYADYLEHRLVEAQNLQRHANIVTEQNNKLYRKVFLLEGKLALLEKEHNIKALLKDRHKLIKARLRIQKAKEKQLEIFLEGVAFSKECKQKDGLIFVDLAKADEVLNKIRKG